jgi:hypothetical protein
VAAAPVDIVALTDGCVEEAAAACARAFHDVELMQLVLPDPVERKKSAPVMFDQAIRFAKLVGVAYVPAGNPNGLLLGWRLPVAEPSLERMMEAGLAPLPDLNTSLGRSKRIRVASFRRPVGIWPCLASTRTTRGKVSAARSCANFRRGRTPTALLRACGRRHRETLVGFYESLGYNVAAEDVVPDTNLRYWIFDRAHA